MTVDLGDLRALPKVELHRHLEGAIRLETVFELSRAAGVRLPAESPKALAPFALVTRPVENLEAALAAFTIAQNAVRTFDSVRRITYEAIQDLAAESIPMAELRFSPQFLCEPGELDWDGAMEAIVDARREAEADGVDVAVGFIAIFSRNYGIESCQQTVAFALRQREHLVGFDIAGPEVGFPPAMYSEAIAPLRDSGLGLTVHYGEAGPPAHVREAIEVLEPARLGHGLSVAWDPDVTRLAVERGVTLEMCPTSNWLTKGVAAVAEHPARRLLLEGVAVTLNTDDPGLMGIDLTHEFEAARDAIGFTEDDFRQVTATALAASFLPEELKADVRDRHLAWVTDPGIPSRFP